jgi:PAS domain S-box-containing protein
VPADSASVPGGLATGRRAVRLPALSFRRFAPVAPYAVCFAATWGLLGLESNVRVAEVTMALALQLVVGVLLFWAPSWGRSRWVRAGGVIMFLVSVWLLRDGVGQTAGYGSLVLLPVISASLRNRRAELIWVIAGAGVVLFAPLVVIGGAHYPQSGWRSGGLLLVIAATLGMAVLELVARLRSSDERQRLLAENSTDLVAQFAPDGTTTYASPASGPLLGYAPDELVGLNITDLLHPQDRYAQNARRARVDETPDAIMQEFRLRHRDGRWIWFEAAIRSIRDSTGAVSGRQGAIRQIQERKRLQGSSSANVMKRPISSPSRARCERSRPWSRPEPNPTPCSQRSPNSSRSCLMRRSQALFASTPP